MVVDIDHESGGTKDALPNDFLIGHRPTSTIFVRKDGENTTASIAYGAVVFCIVLLVVSFIILAWMIFKKR